VLTLKGFGGWRTLSGLSFNFWLRTQGSRKLEPWAKISQRLRRKFEQRKFERKFERRKFEDGLLNREAPGFDHCGEQYRC